MIRIHNTMSGEKEPFTPLDPPRVGMYVCGLTVYDLPHLGHGRSFVGFDVIARWLGASGYDVRFVRNITDIDDRIIDRAQKGGETIGALTERMTTAMHEDFALLGLEIPTVEPRATAYVAEMLALIGRLEAAGLAYRSASGDVNFAVRQHPGYGKLSGRTLDQLRAGERVAVDPSKRDPLDFVLWKAAKPDEPAECRWPSPWGEGRPGWHIECSAMALALLGETVDIHGGGPDLIFPHHENEIAQSEAVTGRPLARYWAHAGQLNIAGDKMSKSLGNFLTIREAAARFSGDVLRFFFVRTHYRSPIDFAETLLDDAAVALQRLYEPLRRAAPDGEPLDMDEAHARRFKAAMDDDFNAARAVAVLFELAGDVNRTGSPALARQLKGLGGVLGLLERDPAESARASLAMDPARIEALIAERAAARARKDFAASDALRDRLAAEGIVLEDGPGGTTWRPG